MYGSISKKANENGPIKLMESYMKKEIVWLARLEEENRLILFVTPVGYDVMPLAKERLGEKVKLINGGDRESFTITVYPVWWKLPEDRVFIKNDT